MQFCTTLEIMRGYFKKALQGSQFCRFRNIIISIHEYDIPSYNAFGRAWLKKQKIKLEKEKKEAQKAFKIAGD